MYIYNLTKLVTQLKGNSRFFCLRIWYAVVIVKATLLGIILTIFFKCSGQSRDPSHVASGWIGSQSASDRDCVARRVRARWSPASLRICCASLDTSKASYTLLKQWMRFGECTVIALFWVWNRLFLHLGCAEGQQRPVFEKGCLVDVAVAVWLWTCSALALISFCEKWKCECATSRWSAAWVEWPDSLKGEFDVTNITLCCMCRRLKKSLCGVMQNLEAACGGVLPCNSTVNTAAIQMMLQTCQSFCLAHLRDLF